MNFFEQQWNNFYNWFVTNSGWLEIAKAVLLILVEFIVIKVVLRIAKRAAKNPKSKMSNLAKTFMISILKVVLYFILIMTILSVIGVNISNIVTAISALSIAISFAISEIATNFASGLIIIGNKPFQEGDYIACSGNEGTVVSTSMFSTRLLTVDNKVVVVPNAVLATNPVTNFSTMPKRRVDLTFGVAYGSDVAKVQKIMGDVLDANKLVLHEDGYNLRLGEEGASSLNFNCRFWVENKDYWDAYFDINEAMLAAFNANGIEIPYNKLDVNILSK